MTETAPAETALTGTALTGTAQHRTTLVLGGTGTIGRRLVERLTRRDLPVRIGSRAGGLPFDWARPTTWGPVFVDVEAAYTYVPDLVVANPAEALAGVVQAALAAGTRRLVLLSGRGEVQAEACEKILMASGADWTILRASFFNQNFDEGYLLEPVLAGHIRLPAGNVGEPFCDTDDIADVAATVLTTDGHVGAIYELTGPRALTFAEATATIAAATGRDITYTRIPPEDFATDLAAGGVAPDSIRVLVDLFGTVLDGRNTAVGDGVEHVLGRPARDLTDYARATAATGIWTPDRPGVGSRRSWQAALLAAIVTIGLTAGFFLAWDVSGMPGLIDLDDRAFVGAFQALDRAIMTSPLFMLVSLGASAFTDVAAALHLRADNRAPPHAPPPDPRLPAIIRLHLIRLCAIVGLHINSMGATP